MAREQKTFESSLTRLTEVVALLERDETPLAEAMALYEEGISLAQFCRKELDAAELRITELRGRASSIMEDNPEEDRA